MAGPSRRMSPDHADTSNRGSGRGRTARTTRGVDVPGSRAGSRPLRARVPRGGRGPGRVPSGPPAGSRRRRARRVASNRRSRTRTTRRGPPPPNHAPRGTARTRGCRPRAARSRSVPGRPIPAEPESGQVQRAHPEPPEEPEAEKRPRPGRGAQRPGSPSAPCGARRQARTISSCGHVSQRPRVKSGNATGRLPRPTDTSDSSHTADSAAASYTFMSVGRPSCRHLMRR